MIHLIHILSPYFAIFHLEFLCSFLSNSKSSSALKLVFDTSNLRNSSNSVFRAPLLRPSSFLWFSDDIPTLLILSQTIQLHFIFFWKNQFLPSFDFPQSVNKLCDFSPCFYSTFPLVLFNFWDFCNNHSNHITQFHKKFAKTNMIKSLQQMKSVFSLTWSSISKLGVFFDS